MNPEQAPLAELRPVRVDVGGCQQDDPYVWLEDNSTESLAWQTAQNALAERRLRDVEGFDSLKTMLGQHLARHTSAPLTVAATAGCALRSATVESGWSRLRRLQVRWRGVFAVEAFSEPDRPASLDWFFPSPDGHYAALGVSWGGDGLCPASA